MSDESISIPPGDERPRRRRYDITPKTALLVLLGSTPVSLPGVWAAGSYLYRAQAVIERVPQLEATVQALEARAEAQAQDLARLRRWQCILGYDPGGKLGQATILPRDRRNECRDGERDKDQ